MALNSCDVITAGLSSYACASNSSGIAGIWLTNIDNLSAMTITGATTSPLVTSITLSGTQKFWAMNPYQFTAEFTTVNSRSEFGNNSYTPSVKFRVNQITTDVMQTVYKMTRSKLGAIIKFNNGMYVLAGVDDTSTPTNSIGLATTKSDLLSGIKASDFSGFDIELGGVQNTYPIEIASSIIAGITSN